MDIIAQGQGHQAHDLARERSKKETGRGAVGSSFSGVLRMPGLYVPT
jgi:hypothetical protein